MRFCGLSGMDGTVCMLSDVRVDMVRFRSVNRSDPTDDVREFRAVGGGRGSGFAAKTSLSKASASALLMAPEVAVRMGVADGSAISGSGGSSMLERTSWSRSPSISISCIFALATNLYQAESTGISSLL